MHHRVSTPLRVQIAGHSYAAVDWSLGGIRVRDWSDFSNVRPGDTFTCCFSLPFQGFDIAFETELEVVRLIEEDSQMAARFTALDDRQKELMNHFIEQLVRGAMVPIDDTILRIDSPVTPVSTKPDPSPAEEVPVSRWPTRLIGMSAFYLMLGSVLFYALAITVYDNFLSLNITHAVTEKPVEPIISLSDGRVEQVAVTTYQSVKPGQPLFQISSPDLDQDIKQAKVDLEKAKVELESLRKKHAVVVDIHKSHLVKEARFLEIEIDEKQQDIALATERVLALYEHRDALQIASPGDGRIVRVMRNSGSIVRKGDTLAYFEHDAESIVVAYVTQDEAGYLALRDIAYVRSNLFDGSRAARIAAIEPIETITTRFSSDDRIIRVELQLQDASIDLPSGSPVKVEFPATVVDDIFRKDSTGEPQELLVLGQASTGELR